MATVPTEFHESIGTPRVVAVQKHPPTIAIDIIEKRHRNNGSSLPLIN